jgi:hypothetical protein
VAKALKFSSTSAICLDLTQAQQREASNAAQDAAI